MHLVGFIIKKTVQVLFYQFRSKDPQLNSFHTVYNNQNFYARDQILGCDFELSSTFMYILLTVHLNMIL